MDYKQLGLDVFRAVGGNDNVTVITHCATRLRFKLKDSSNVNKAEIEKIPGVLKVVEAGGQFQIVVGPSVSIAFQAVQEVYKPSSGSAGSQDTGKKKESDEKKSLGARFLGTIAGIFPVFIGDDGTGNFTKALITLVLSFVITFGVSWFMKLDPADQDMEHAN